MAVCPPAVIPAGTLAAVRGAIIAGSMLEFEYGAESKDEAAWRRAIPLGLINGPISYLVGKIPKGEKPPIYFRLGRMENSRASNQHGVVSEDFDLDEWLSESLGIWRDAQHDVTLRIKQPAAARAREWRFHPKQQRQDEPNACLIVSFIAGGLRDFAEHTFCWGADVEILSPDELRSQMVAMLEAALARTDPRIGGRTPGRGPLALI